MMDNTKKSQGQATQLLFNLILLMALIISGLLTIVFGANVYENINERANENFNSVTALSYVSSKVRQEDVSSAISVEKQGGVCVLKIRESYDGTAYDTKIYTKDGNLKELFSAADSNIALADGLDIMKLKNIEFEMEKPNLLRVSIDNGTKKSEGKVDEVMIHLRSE